MLDLPLPSPTSFSIIRTFETLFWPLFGVGSKGSGGGPRPMHSPPEWIQQNDPWKGGLFSKGDSVKWIARWAETMSGFYYLIMIIILINMLIAMMSHSYNSVQVIPIKNKRISANTKSAENGKQSWNVIF